MGKLFVVLKKFIMFFFLPIMGKLFVVLKKFWLKI